MLPSSSDIPRDCSEIAEQASRSRSTALQPGVYVIDPDGKGAFDAFCRFSDGKGYTIFQRRMNGGESFNRTWTEYALGFGDLDGEFWLGLEYVHRLTQNTYRYGSPELNVHLRAFHGASYEAKYTYFKVLGESQNYKIFAAGYEGDAGDAFGKPQNRFESNKMEFSTFDKDNDKDQNKNCADAYKSGWWFNRCFCANLNGVYDGNANVSDWEGVIWATAEGQNSFEWTEMTVRTSAK